MLRLFTGIISLLALSLEAHAQGAVIFNNRTQAGDAPIIYPDRLAPSDVKAQLILVGEGGSLTPLFPITTFRDSPPAARYWIREVNPLFVPGIPILQPATFHVRAWEGESYEDAVSRGLAHGESNDVFVRALGDPNAPGNLIFIPTLVGLQGFTLVPEPSTITLGILAAMILRRSRRT